MLTISPFEVLIILAIISFNFLAIICFKNKIMVMSLVTIANLIVILLYSTIISDYLVLQELIIATVFYSITTLILISNVGFIVNFSFGEEKRKLERKKISIKKQIDRVFTFIVIIFFSTIFVLGVFYFNNDFQSNRLNKLSNDSTENLSLDRIKRDSGSISNKIDNAESVKNTSKSNEDLEKEDSKEITYQKSVEKNILFKRSTDAILIMIGAVLVILLYDKFWKEKREI